MAPRVGLAAHFNPAPGQPPSAPFNVTTLTRDAGAQVSFRAPTDQGSSAITHYVITPYIGASAQAATTVAVGSTTTITGSDGNTYRRADVTGLTNSTAYTFTVTARNGFGDSAASAASGANTPLANLVLGDDFNGPANGPIDPEWWIYNRCGYIAQSEVQWYLPSQVKLDGAGNLLLVALKQSVTGPSYPSDGNTTRTQAWRSGAFQTNTKTFAPAAGKTSIFACKMQIPHDITGGMWPSPWLNGQSALNAWKTDPAQGGWNDTDHAEIDIAEWIPGQTDNTTYFNNTWTTSSPTQHTESGTDWSAAQYEYSVQWRPGVRVVFQRNGVTTFNTTSSVPASGCQLVPMVYLQIMAGAASSPEQVTIDYFRIFEQTLL